MGTRPIWPRILGALSGGHAFSAEMISIMLGDERPESVYASMSSLGAYDNRWWIRPMDYWRRDGLFYITVQGASALRKYTRKHS